MHPRDGRRYYPQALEMRGVTIIDGLVFTIELNIGGVNEPTRIAVLEKGTDGKYAARRLEKIEFEEHKQNMDGAYQALRDYQSGLHAATSEKSPPEVPTTKQT